MLTLPTFRRAVLALVALLWLPAIVCGGPRHTTNVPPGFEIEVLNPNADPLNRPAVELYRTKDGQLEVVVPPVVLVHKYYYTGDRSFQAQFLPGGPTIIVVNHPKTGERCYVETNMMPGAPRVTYTGHGIEYNFGEHGMTLSFPTFGQPKVKYRSGFTWHQRAAKVVHAEQLKDYSQRIAQHSKFLAADTKASLHEVWVDGAQAIEDLTLPIQQFLRVVPLGNALMDPDRARVRAEKIDAYHREQRQRRLEMYQAVEGVTRRTNR